MKLGKLADLPQLHIHLDQLPNFDLMMALERGLFIRWTKNELTIRMCPTPQNTLSTPLTTLPAIALSDVMRRKEMIEKEAEE